MKIRTNHSGGHAAHGNFVEISARNDYRLKDGRFWLDNNDSERLIRNSAVGRKNYYGSGAEWWGRLAVMLFSIFATLALGKINPREWLNWYFKTCAECDGKIPNDPASFLPRKLTKDWLAELQDFTSGAMFPGTS